MKETFTSNVGVNGIRNNSLIFKAREKPTITRRSYDQQCIQGPHQLRMRVYNINIFRRSSIIIIDIMWQVCRAGCQVASCPTRISGRDESNIGDTRYSGGTEDVWPGTVWCRCGCCV